MAKTFTLGRNERLKQRKFIEQLFREGKTFSVFPFRVYYLFQEDLSSPLQAGFSASTRNFKRAVDRNRIKRVAREAYRLQKTTLVDELKLHNLKLAVFFIYTDKTLPAFEVLKNRIEIALQKLIRIIHETDTSGT